MIVINPNVTTYFTQYPFQAISGSDSYEYQQIFDARLFGSNPFSISALEFVTNAAEGTVFDNNAIFEIHLSATTQWVNNLRGDNLAANFTNDAEHESFISPTLFWQGRVTTVGAGNKVRIAGLPFNFDPAMGNLIVDIWRTPDRDANGNPIAPAPTNVGFMAQTGGYQYMGPDNGRTATDQDWLYAYSRVSNYWDPMDQSQNMNQGLVMGFEYGPPVPEPGTFGLLAAGLIVGLALARRRRKTIV